MTAVDLDPVNRWVTLRLAIAAASAKLRQALIVEDPNRTAACVVAALDALDTFEHATTVHPPRRPPVKPLFREPPTAPAPAPKPVRVERACPLPAETIETIRLLSHGMTTEQVATELVLSRDAVRSRLAHARTTLNVSTQAGLVGECHRQGWLTAQEPAA